MTKYYYYLLNIDAIKTIEDIKEALKLCHINVSFTNTDLITDKNKHLIKAIEQKYGC
jgi:hypothetical protein